MATDLSGKVALVTGAAGGIGSVTTRALGEAGARVVLADLPSTPLGEVAGKLNADGIEAVHHDVDITDEASVVAIIAFVNAAFGRLDVVDNNAGATGFQGQDLDVTSTTTDVWDQVMAINTRGTMLMCKHAIPLMVEGGGGAIVNISSGQSLAGDLTNVAYSASKAAVNQLTRHVATVFGVHGIRCNAIAPGLVATPPLEASLPPPVRELFVAECLVPRLGDPRDIAETVVFLASDRAAYITGQILSVDGGFSAHLPSVTPLRQMFAQLSSE